MSSYNALMVKKEIVHNAIAELKENNINRQRSYYNSCRLDHHQFQYEYSKNELKNEEKDYYTFEGNIDTIFYHCSIFPPLND